MKVEETGRTVTHILEEGVTWFSAVLYPPAVAAAGVREGGGGRASIDGAVGGRHFPSSHPAASQDTTQLVRLQSGWRERQMGKDSEVR